MVDSVTSCDTCNASTRAPTTILVKASEKVEARLTLCPRCIGRWAEFMARKDVVDRLKRRESGL